MSEAFSPAAQLNRSTGAVFAGSGSGANGSVVIPIDDDTSETANDAAAPTTEDVVSIISSPAFAPAVPLTQPTTGASC